MTYIELLNSYWDSTRFNPISGNEGYMYLYLLHQCNVRRWINPFEFKTRNLELSLGLTRATISAIRNKLKQRGLIDFSNGSGKGSAVYLICGIEITDEELAGKFSVQKLNNKLNTKSGVVQKLNDKLNNSLNNSLNTKANHSLYREDKRLNKTEKSSAPAGATHHSDSLFAEEDLEGKKKTGNRQKSPQATFPTYEEVRQYFLTAGADKRLEDWEESCQRFFDNYTAVDWRDKYNRRITRWDSRANNWIATDEKRQKEQNKNESKKADRFSERRGTEPASESRKGFKGTF